MQITKRAKYKVGRILAALMLSVFLLFNFSSTLVAQTSTKTKTTQDARNKLESDINKERDEATKKAESDAKKAKETAQKKLEQSKKTIDENHQKEVKKVEETLGKEVKGTTKVADEFIQSNNDKISKKKAEINQPGTTQAQKDKLQKEISNLETQNKQMREVAKEQIDDALKKYNTDLQKAADKKTADLKKADEVHKRAINKADQDLAAKKTQIQKETDFTKAIELDKDKFNVGQILKAKNQKTFFEKATASKRPVIIEVIDQVTTFMLRLVIPISVLALIIGGYFMMFSQGEESRLNTGKSILTNTAIGLVIIFGSFLIVQFIISIFYQQ